MATISGSAMLYCGGRLRSANLGDNTHEVHVLLHHVPTHMFGKNIRRSVDTRNLCEAEIILANPILHPKISDMKVPDAAEAAPTTYTNSGSGISQHLQTEIDTHIGRQCLKAQSM